MALEALREMYEKGKVPNVLLHGPFGAGKKTIIKTFLEEIYEGEERRSHVLYVHCLATKGIQFIREEVKTFAKGMTEKFKSIVLVHADKLSVDAQSAIRRCIEVYNHHTRFFLIVEDKQKLLRPILSRFCDFYVPPRPPSPNLFAEYDQTRHVWLRKQWRQNPPQTVMDCMTWANRLFDRAYSGLDLIQYVEKFQKKEGWNIHMLLQFAEWKETIGHEPTLMFMMLCKMSLNVKKNIDQKENDG